MTQKSPQARAVRESSRAKCPGYSFHSVWSLAFSEVLAARANRSTRTNTSQPRWAWFHRWRWVFGVPFALCSFFASYSVAGGDGTYRIYGLPFPMAAFDQNGRLHRAAYAVGGSRGALVLLPGPVALVLAKRLLDSEKLAPLRSDFRQVR